MSVSFNKIYGNDLLKRVFSESIENGKLPHAMILSGEKGSGRYSFALNIAAASLCTASDKPCGSCKNCRQIFEGVAPDVMTVSLPEDKATVSVESVRFIKSDAQNVPVESDLKYYIIRDADKMTVQAQNALLKILEEPPSFVIFVLICENENLLLPTIRSRACVFRMQRFEDEELARYVVSVNADAQSLLASDEALFNRIMKSANGCIGAVLGNLNKQNINRIRNEYQNINHMLTALFGNNKAEYLSFEDELPSKREELRAFLFVFRNSVRDILSVKKGSSSDLLFFEGSEDIKKISKTATLLSVVSLLDVIDEALNANEQNANINLLRINLMNTMWKCIH
ncbi:MAG: hypothetical protein IJA55_01530 [Clostridia bacterium]|nr:hypothetical protein [Clostridia bacterium]